MNDYRPEVDSGVFSPCEAASYWNCKVVGSGRRRRSHVSWVLDEVD